MATDLTSKTMLTALWRPLSAAETDTAEQLIQLASETLRSQIKNLDERIAAGTINAQTVSAAVALKVKSFMTNADGHAQVSQSLGSGSLTRTYAKGTNTIGAFRFSAGEIADIVGTNSASNGSRGRTLRTRPATPPGWAAP